MAIKVKLEGGLRKVDYHACIHLQHIIHNLTYPVGKIVINPQEISFYKFGMKMGIYHIGRDPYVDIRNGEIIFNGTTLIPPIHDSHLVEEIYNQCN